MGNESDTKGKQKGNETEKRETDGKQNGNATTY